MSNVPGFNLGRGQIEKWAGPNHKLIKAIEDLFNASEADTPGDFEEASILAENADSKAVQAISDLQKISDTQKGLNVLLWLSM